MRTSGSVRPFGQVARRRERVQWVEAAQPGSGHDSTVPHMLIAGIHLRRQTVLELASLLSRGGADVAARNVTTAITTGKDEVVLSEDDRASIVDVLRDPPPELTELHSALLAEHGY